jgi:hypothetical protein
MFGPMGEARTSHGVQPGVPRGGKAAGQSNPVKTVSLVPRFAQFELASRISRNLASDSQFVPGSMCFWSGQALRSAILKHARREN